MNILQLISWPWWTVWALYGSAAVLALLILGSVKSLLGWPGLLVVLAIIALGVGEMDGARRSLAWAHEHHLIKKVHVTDYLGIFFF